MPSEATHGRAVSTSRLFGAAFVGICSGLRTSASASPSALRVKRDRTSGRLGGTVENNRLLRPAGRRAWGRFGLHDGAIPHWPTSGGSPVAFGAVTCGARPSARPRRGVAPSLCMPIAAATPPRRAVLSRQRENVVGRCNEDYHRQHRITAGEMFVTTDSRRPSSALPRGEHHTLAAAREPLGAFEFVPASSRGNLVHRAVPVMTTFASRAGVVFAPHKAARNEEAPPDAPPSRAQ